MVRFSLPSISLAAKCRIVFGLAVLLIIGSALTVPWLRMTDLVHEKNFQIARQMGVLAVQRATLTPGDWTLQQRSLDDWWAQQSATHGLAGPAPRLIAIDPLNPTPPAGEDEYVAHCIGMLARKIGLDEAPLRVEKRRSGHLFYRVVLPVRSRGDRGSPGTLLGVVSVEYPASKAGADLIENEGLIVMAGALAGILAVLVFYIITQKLILSPVRELRAVADEVSGGNHEVRSTIATGDEFEDLARAFNAMLVHLEQQQDELRAANRSLDTRLGELAERNVALYEGSRMKSQFIANVSHELRTPLTSIIGFAELLREGGADLPRAQRYMQNILDSGRNLLTIINDLLDLAKIEAGKFILHRGPVNLHDMVANLIDFVSPLAEKKQLHLDGQVDERTPVIESDSGRIQQILFNLMSNAVKFSEPGGRVIVRIGPDEEKGVRMTVVDRGIGIPEDQLSVIFEKFQQIDGSMTREHSGTGLGLAITKELVEILGGRISVQSVVGEGSEFCVVLPLVCPETADMPATALT